MRHQPPPQPTAPSVLRPLARATSLAALLALGACAGATTLAPGQSFPVFFANAAVVPDQTGVAVIDQAVQWTRRYPTEQVSVTGYADPRAPTHEAQQLATRRADQVAALLEEKGVSPTRIRRAIGDEALIGISGLGNRRVDIAVGL